MVDFLIKCGMPYRAEENIIITTTLVEKLLKLYLDNSLSHLPQQKLFVKQKRDEYQYFTLKPFKIYLCCCMESHFYVISLILDIKNPDGTIFYDVHIYDSMKHTVCTNMVRLLYTSPAGTCRKIPMVYCNVSITLY